LLINLSQIAKDHQSIDIAFYKKYCLHNPVPSNLFDRSKRDQNQYRPAHQRALLLVAAKDFSSRVNNFVNLVVRHEKSYFILMGIVHGLTNLGGPLLTGAVHSKGYGKRTARATVAASYATFATFQLVTLFFSNFDMDIKLSTISFRVSDVIGERES
jgi:hypothetical protein